MFKLTVVTPARRLVVDLEVEEVVVPAFRGELDLLPGHAPLITTLEPGVLRWRTPGSDVKQVAAIGWGYCQVHPQGVDILADIAETAEDVNASDSEKEIAALEQRLAVETLDEEQFEVIRRQIALSRAEIEITKGPQA